MNERRQNTRAWTGPRAFTLIELLVVVSIMSVLMSILLPGLNQAREAGKRIVCLSNLQQLTLAWYFYAEDNDDRLCSPDTYWNDTVGSRYWVADGPAWPTNDIGGTETAIRDGVLWPYTEETLDLYKCKSDRSYLLRSYSISNTMGGQTRDEIRTYSGLGEFSRASEKMVFTDAGTRLPWIVNGFWPIEINDGVLRWRLEDGHNISARHRDGCNMSFADFHCEHWRWRDRRTIKLAYWEIGPVEASDYNPDLERLFQSLK
jgi:prepilin-type N-terminal cleavage/methylation domain-containing protein/prepilin-type processing-associated H-X9-DG protein